MQCTVMFQEVCVLTTFPSCSAMSFQDHNEPALDGISFDLLNYADLRSFQLQLNKQFINYRLPLRDSRGAGPGATMFQELCSGGQVLLFWFHHQLVQLL